MRLANSNSDPLPGPQGAPPCKDGTEAVGCRSTTLRGPADMVDEFEQEFIIKTLIESYCIPMYLTHVIAGLNFRILFAQFDRPFGITF